MHLKIDVSVCIYRENLLPPPATFMPNTFDQFGQPIVMMPYPPQSSTAAGEPGDEAVPVESSDNLAPEDGAVLTNDLVVTAEAPELIIQEEVSYCFSDLASTT